MTLNLSINFNRSIFSYTWNVPISFVSEDDKEQENFTRIWIDRVPSKFCYDSYMQCK